MGMLPPRGQKREAKPKEKRYTDIVVDSNCIGHIAKHSMKGLSYADQETGVIFGFLNEVFRLAKRFNTNQFVFAWDSRKSYRREVYPDYKRKRLLENKDPEAQRLSKIAFNQFHQLRTYVLPEMGFQNIFMQTGYEADDVIGRVGLSYGNTKDTSLVVVSTDEDLYQQLFYYDIYNPRKKEVFTKEWFKQEYGIPANEWSCVKAIAGCGSDNVAGIESIGEKTAIKWMRGELKKTSEAYKKIDSDEGKDLSNKNLKIVRIPFIGDPQIQEFLLARTSYDREDFERIFEEFGFRSFLRSMEEWERLFDLQ